MSKADEMFEELGMRRTLTNLDTEIYRFKDDYIEQFKNGIILEDGYKTMPADIELISESSANLTIHEGKFHQVKRMFLALNMEVTYLKRISFGSLKLDESLKKGEYRLLTDQEIELLKKD